MEKATRKDPSETEDFHEIQIIDHQSAQADRHNNEEKPVLAPTSGSNIPYAYPQASAPTVYNSSGPGMPPPQQYSNIPVYANNPAYPTYPVNNGYNPAYIPTPQRYPPQNLGIQPIVIYQTDVVSQQFGETYYKVLKYSRIVRYLALLEVLVNFFYFMAVPFLLFMIAFCVLGYFGGRMFNKCMCVGYIAYLIFMVVARIILMCYYPFV